MMVKRYKTISPRAHRTKAGPKWIDALAAAKATDRATSHTNRLYWIWIYKFIFRSLIIIVPVSLLLLISWLG